MTPRATDWSLAFLVALLCTTGLLSLISGDSGGAWVFVLHGVAGIALVAVTVWKLRRVWRRAVDPRQWNAGVLAGLLATAFVVAALLSGLIWSGGGDLFVAGFNLLNWHILLGVLLSLAVAEHARVRARRPRQRDLLQRRQLLHTGVIALGALAAWRLQRPFASFWGWRGANRRWTGSYEAGSFAGNAFPATSWVADRPRPLRADSYRLQVGGLVETPLDLSLEDLSGVDTVEATLDCTGGFYSTQHWSGIRLQRLIEHARPLPTATHIRVISHTGYRWSYPLAEADDLLLATAVADEFLSHEHGAPLRLVAPGRRGFQWIKWVVRLELQDGPDIGAPASTLWSSWTRAGRGQI